MWFPKFLLIYTLWNFLVSGLYPPLYPFPLGKVPPLSTLWSPSVQCLVHTCYALPTCLLGTQWMSRLWKMKLIVSYWGHIHFVIRYYKLSSTIKPQTVIFPTRITLKEVNAIKKFSTWFLSVLSLWGMSPRMVLLRHTPKKPPRDTVSLTT